MVLVEVLAHSDELAKRLSSKRMSFEDTKNGVDIRNKLKEVGMCLELKRYKCYSQLTMKVKGNNRNKRIVKDNLGREKAVFGLEMMVFLYNLERM